MIILNLFIAIIIPTVAGLIIVSATVGKEPRSTTERSALALGIGLGLITLTMFTLNLCNLKLSYPLILGSTLLIISPFAGWILFKRYPLISLAGEKSRPSLPPFPKEGNREKALAIFKYVLLGMLTLKVAHVFFAALVKPITEFDALWRHALIAKAVFLEKTFCLPFTLTLIKANPPFTSFAQSWIFFSINSWNECLGKIIFPLLFLSLLLVFYCNLRKYFSALYALVFTFLLASLPFLVFHATSAYADFPQAYFYSIGTLYAFIFIKDGFKNRTDLILALIFLGLCTFVKRHGIYLAGINCLVLLVAIFSGSQIPTKTKISYLLSMLIILPVLSAPMFYFNQALFKEVLGTAAVPFAQQEITIKENLPPLAQRMAPALTIFTQKMFWFGNWHLAWAAFLLSTFFFFKTVFKPPLIYLWIIIILNLIYTFAALTLIGTYRFLLDGTLLNRMMLYYMPVVITFCAFAAKDFKK